LRIGPTDSVAFVGSGGKSSAIFRVARELTPPVFVSVSTHLAKSQLTLSDRHVIIEEAEGLLSLEYPESSHVTLFTGRNIENNRVGGLSPEVLDDLISFAKTKSIPVLIEADGSRLRALKAPGDHEPLIPSSIDLVVVVVGLTALDKPLDDEWVHRPELFARISGATQGQPISVNILSQALLHKSGGMKNIPPQARRVVLLNQADSEELQAKANNIASQLTSSFDAVIVSSLGNPNDGIGNNKPFKQVDGEGREVFAVYEHIAGIILAAGASRRLGTPKPLLSWKGETFVRHVVRTALHAGLSPVVLITGSSSDLVRDSIRDLPVNIAHNPEWETGQASSVRAGINTLPENVGGAIFLLVDQPQIPATLIRALYEKHSVELSPIIAPIIDGQRGNPVLFDRATFQDLIELQGDTGGRGIFSRYSIDWIEWQDGDLLLDVDTDDDYKRLLGLSS
jgi:molybdenum cofactor cytidylyltransferase